MINSSNINIYKPKNKIIQNIIIKHKFHVPTFVIISFFFLYNSLLTKKIKKYKERLERLLIPYIIYPILTYIININLYYIFQIDSLKTSLYKLITQLILGRGLYGVLWFHFNLILITIFFYIISLIFKHNFLTFFQIVQIFSYIIQFSQINFKFFNTSKSGSLFPFCIEELLSPCSSSICKK